MGFKAFPYDEILAWYHHHGRHDLPWRIDFDPYKVWIAEIFLQQTQVSRVREYFERVVKAFPNIESLAKVSYDEFFSYYKGLGYYSRARNMLKTAQIIVSDYDGIFPEDYKSLISLPGVGPYTANAILAFGYNKPVLAFDTNIEKIFSRYYFGTRFEKLSFAQKSELQDQFASLGLSGREINAALMDFASTVDVNNSSSIDWKNYPLHDSKFFQTRGILEIAPTRVTQKYDTSKAQIVVFLHKNHRIYYSPDVDIYRPFVLPSTGEKHRHYIQNYFLQIYGLEVSVRPPFRRSKTHFLYHAQIQTGQSEFGEFGKREYSGEVREYEKI